MGAAPGDVVKVETPRGVREWRVDGLGLHPPGVASRPPTAGGEHG